MTHQVLRRATHIQDRRLLGIAATCLCLAACATPVTATKGQISSYDGLEKTGTRRTHAYVKVDAKALANVKTFMIEPVAFMDGAGAELSSSQRKLVANVASRALCDVLSQKFKSAPNDETPDMLVRAHITSIAPTNRPAAALSFVLGKVSPVPMTPRIPLGLGSLSVEAEALDTSGRQIAALVWARGADAFTTKPEFSRVGDGYQMSKMFGEQFGDLLVRGENPIHDVSLPRVPHAPWRHRLDPGCDRFGKGPGIKGFVAAKLAGAPEWVDHAPTSPASDATP